MDIITLTTDFGLTDEYLAAMKGVILKINPAVQIIDISHNILPQNITQGAFVLYSVVKYYPKAIHIGVVDPGVGTSREALIFNCSSGVLVGPDNGLLVPAAEKLGILDVYKITNPEYSLENISSTFHGRDIFAPVAAHLSKGVPVENIGEKTKKFINLHLFDCQDLEDKIIGRVLNIDNFGNVITNISKDIIKNYFNFNETMQITIAESNRPLEIPFKQAYGEAQKNSLLATISSSGFLELAGNQCRASEKLNIRISDKIEIRK